MELIRLRRPPLSNSLVNAFGFTSVASVLRNPFSSATIVGKIYLAVDEQIIYFLWCMFYLNYKKLSFQAFGIH